MSDTEQIKIVDIVENEIDEQLDILKDEVFENLKESFIKEKRLLKRFYDFCEDYNFFEYDEMGMNMEDGETALRFVNKINEKILNNIQNDLSYKFKNIEVDTFKYKVSFILEIEQYKFTIVLEVLTDSFNLEIV